MHDLVRTRYHILVYSLDGDILDYSERLMKTIEPNARQKLYFSSPADIVIYGGSAGGGKTFALLLEHLRFQHVKGFDTVYFRRRRTDLTKSGSAWPESFKLYPHFRAVPNLTYLRWTFPSGSTITMNGLARDHDIEHWATSQIGCLIFDQLEAFTGNQFYGLTERLRSMCGVTPYVRAACNPNPDCFLHNDGTGVGTGLISWWVDEDGWAIPERSGVVRWFQRINEKLIWGESKEELRRNIDRALDANKQAPLSDEKFFPTSITFILATIYDNVDLLAADKRYLATLHNLPYVRRMRMLGEGGRGGNWNIRATAGNVFRRGWFMKCSNLPGIDDDVTACRFWDIAATISGTEDQESDTGPDYVSGTRVHRKGEDYYIINNTTMRGTPGEVEAHIETTADMDGKDVTIVIEGEPGSQSLLWGEHIKRKMTGKGYHVVVVPSRHSKVTRAMPYSALAEQHHVFYPDPEEYDVPWWERFILQHENFPPKASRGKDDIVDSASGAINYLRSGGSLSDFEDEPGDLKNAVAAHRAPRGVFSESDGEPINIYLPRDDEHDRLPWDKH